MKIYWANEKGALDILTKIGCIADRAINLLVKVVTFTIPDIQFIPLFLTQITLTLVYSNRALYRFRTFRFS